MDAVQRRNAIMEELHRGNGPVSAGTLAERFGVSRQIVVGDVALLRASGANITATARGYVLNRPREGIHTVACCHDMSRMEEELLLMVDYGCTVEDVIVEHSVYGQITGQLGLSSRYEVKEFMCRVKQMGARPLSDLTDGIHVHTVRCSDPGAWDGLLKALRQAGFLVE